MMSVTTSQAQSWASDSHGETVRADAIAIPKLTPMIASLEAPLRPGRVPSTTSGVNASANEESATNHSGDVAVFEEARAART
jgi:hypothetical protein